MGVELDSRRSRRRVSWESGSTPADSPSSPMGVEHDSRGVVVESRGSRARLSRSRRRVHGSRARLSRSRRRVSWESSTTPAESSSSLVGVEHDSRSRRRVSWESSTTPAESSSSLLGVEHHSRGVVVESPGSRARLPRSHRRVHGSRARLARSRRRVSWESSTTLAESSSSPMGVERDSDLEVLESSYPQTSTSIHSPGFDSFSVEWILARRAISFRVSPSGMP